MHAFSHARGCLFHGALQLTQEEREAVAALCENPLTRKGMAEQSSTSAQAARASRGTLGLVLTARAEPGLTRPVGIARWPGRHTAWTELERRFRRPGTHTADPNALLDEDMVVGLRTMFRPHRDYLARVVHGS